MAENKKEENKKQKKTEPKKVAKEIAVETKKEIKKPQPLKPYVYIDTFLQTAKPLFKLSNVEVRGFRTYMNGRHYQRDETIFLEKLKEYLGIDQ